MSYLLKVSQNGKVSPRNVQKACHSPYLPKRVSKVTSWNSEVSVSRSLLSQGINGLLLTINGCLLSKRRSVDGMYTLVFGRGDGHNTPCHRTAVSFLIVALAGAPSDILNGLGFRRFAPDYD